MRIRCATDIKAGVILTAALGLVAMTWRDETISAVRQANTGQNHIVQEEKPFDQQQALAELRKKIAGQENKPAGEVFKNIQIYKRLPARFFLGAMEFVYSKSLGVDCRHCHAIDQWEKEDKPTKQIARDMFLMTNSINTEALKKVKNLKSANPIVSCYTCHRGQIKPEVELPELKK